MEEVSVIVVNGEGGDWSGLFVNGELECEGHNIYTRDWIDLIKKYKYFKQVETFTVTDEYLESRGNFPSKFTDIPGNAFI